MSTNYPIKGSKTILFILINTNANSVDFSSFSESTPLALTDGYPFNPCLISNKNLPPSLPITPAWLAPMHIPVVSEYYSFPKIIFLSFIEQPSVHSIVNFTSYTKFKVLITGWLYIV